MLVCFFSLILFLLCGWSCPLLLHFSFIYLFLQKRFFFIVGYPERLKQGVDVAEYFFLFLFSLLYMTICLLKSKLWFVLLFLRTFVALIEERSWYFCEDGHISVCLAYLPIWLSFGFKWWLTRKHGVTTDDRAVIWLKKWPCFLLLAATIYGLNIAYGNCVRFSEWAYSLAFFLIYMNHKDFDLYQLRGYWSLSPLRLLNKQHVAALLCRSLRSNRQAIESANRRRQAWWTT